MPPNLSGFSDEEACYAFVLAFYLGDECSSFLVQNCFHRAGGFLGFFCSGFGLSQCMKGYMDLVSLPASETPYIAYGDDTSEERGKCRLVPVSGTSLVFGLYPFPASHGIHLRSWSFGTPCSFGSMAKEP